MKSLTFLTWAALTIPATAMAQAPGAKPATVEEAAKVLDLASFPILPGAAAPGPRRLASLNYQAKAGAKEAFAFQKKALAERGWAELPGGYADGQTASSMFEGRGYRASVTVIPGGKSGTVSVMINNLGNVDLKALPAPAGSKTLYEGPATRMLIAEQAPEVAAEACKKALAALGWRPYGEAGNQRFYKQNAVRLSVNSDEAPAQGGKTVVSYSAELLSVDLPTPAEAFGVQYSDTTKRVNFDTKQSIKEVVSSYRDILAAAGWKATTDAPADSDFEKVLLFRNPSKDILFLKMRPIDDGVRVSLAHQTKAELEEEIRLAQEREAERKADAKGAMPGRKAAKLTVTATLPAAATEVKATASEITFKLAGGKAVEAVRTLRTALIGEGWVSEVEALESVGGVVSLEKGDARLTIHYIDPGLLPAEVTLSAVGATLAKPKRP